MLYILYSIVIYKYKEYKISSHIESIKELNIQIKEHIDIAKSIIEYKKSKAYINKILKQDYNLKNKWEKVIYLTTEDKYNIYTSEPKKDLKIDLNSNRNDNITDSMSNYEKWIYFIFKKDIRL